MLYKFECKITDKDYFEFNKYTTVDSPDVKKHTLVSKLLIPIILFIQFMVCVIRGDDWYYLSHDLVIFIVVSVVWFFGIMPFCLFVSLHSVKSMSKHGKMPYSESAVMEFYDDCFIEITDDTKSQIQYDAVFKVRINKDKAIYIYQNSILAYIIPFDVFESDDDRNGFIEFISERTKK